MSQRIIVTRPETKAVGRKEMYRMQSHIIVMFQASDGFPSVVVLDSRLVRILKLVRLCRWAVYIYIYINKFR